MSPRRPLVPGAGFFLGLVLLVGSAAAAPEPVPEAELTSAPSAQRILIVHGAAQRDGWAPHAAVLRSAAVRAYERDRPAAAGAWLNLYRWAALLAQSERESATRWVAAVQASGAGHANLPARLEAGGRPLADRVGRDLQLALLRDAPLSAEFFALLSPLDYAPRVLAILDDLHRGAPRQFQSHPSLALALAVVHDVPPPPDWPHAQVGPGALPRAWPAPQEAFAWWIRQEQAGRTYHRLARLPAEELRFVVDAVAPFTELEWAQGAVNLALPDWSRAYAMVPYRQDRVTSGHLEWTGASYRLADILAAGGICADQAYFATESGKARGVPTLLFHGPGQDGRHAWFGFLDANRNWQLDAGRHPDLRLVTGRARDPQTWLELSDHELRFLTERFRALPAYRLASVHQAFAAEYLAGGDALAAGRAARRAVTLERRHEPAWETLLAAAARAGSDAKAREALLREAALAFGRYPDLEVRYARRVAASLRARGEVSAADAEERRVALKHQGLRTDLAVAQARDEVARARATEPLAGQIRVFNSVVDRRAPGAGMAFFDEVVVPFVVHLLDLRQSAEARRALERARQVLQPASGSQLAGECDALAARVRAAR